MPVQHPKNIQWNLLAKFVLRRRLQEREDTHRVCVSSEGELYCLYLVQGGLKNIEIKGICTWVYKYHNCMIKTSDNSAKSIYNPRHKDVTTNYKVRKPSSCDRNALCNLMRHIGNEFKMFLVVQPCSCNVECKPCRVFLDYQETHKSGRNISLSRESI